MWVIDVVKKSKNKENQIYIIKLSKVIADSGRQRECN